MLCRARMAMRRAGQRRAVDQRRGVFSTRKELRSRATSLCEYRGRRSKETSFGSFVYFWPLVSFRQRTASRTVANLFRAFINTAGRGWTPAYFRKLSMRYAPLIGGPPAGPTFASAALTPAIRRNFGRKNKKNKEVYRGA